MESIVSYTLVGVASAALASVSHMDTGSLFEKLKARYDWVSGDEIKKVAAGLTIILLLRLVYKKLTAPPAFCREAVGTPREPCVGEAETIAALPSVVDELRTTFTSGRTRTYEWRIQQLRGLNALLAENGDEIYAACKADCGKAMTEWFFEKKSIMGDCDMAIAGLRKWMKPAGRSTPFWMQPARSYVIQEPLGTVLIVVPWNYPIALALQPLIGCFAAGNVAVLKPSEAAPHQSALLAKLLPRYIDSSALAVVEGGVEVAKAAIAQSYDFVFYTGGPAVGSIVAQTCSKSLTPFCLELGGKSPTLIDQCVSI